jgi:peptide methionine sulfoxide reductase MsrB
MSEESRIISKNNQEWKQQLTKEQYEISRLKGTEYPFTGNIGITKKMAPTTVFVVVLNYSVLKQSMILVPVGQVSGLLLRYRT